LYRATLLDLEFCATLLTTLNGAVTIAPVVRATTDAAERTGVLEQVPFVQSAKTTEDEIADTTIASIRFFINNLLS
jgi:hypothetical protein